MRCKVILSSKELAVEIISELEKVEKGYILSVLKEFENYEDAKEYVFSEACTFSSYLVVDIADIIMIIPKRDIGKYSDINLLKAFITLDKAEKFKEECYNALS